MTLTREEQGRRRIYDKVQRELFEVLEFIQQHDDLFTQEEVTAIDNLAVRCANQVIDLDLKAEGE